MAFHYFAYGSNLWAPRLLARCPSASFVTTGRLTGWRVSYRKPGADGSAKLDVVPAAGEEVHGAVYRIHDADGPSLDAAEPGYDRIEVPVAGLDCRTYRWPGPPTDRHPEPWYVRFAVEGARAHGLPEAYVAAALLPAGHGPAE